MSPLFFVSSAHNNTGIHHHIRWCATQHNLTQPPPMLVTCTMSSSQPAPSSLPPVPQAVAELRANQNENGISSLPASGSDSARVAVLPPDSNILLYINESDVVEGNCEMQGKSGTPGVDNRDWDKFMGSAVRTGPPPQPHQVTSDPMEHMFGTSRQVQWGKTATNGV